MRLLLLVLGVVLGSGALAAGCGGGSDTDGLCDPGAFIFCKCQNGDDGSKECNADGASFKACMAQAGGECPEDTSTSGDPTGDPGPASTSGDPGGPGGAGGTGGGGTGTTKFLEPCGMDEDCESGFCPMGYCTMPCAAVSECPLDISECVKIGSDTQICLATCGFVGADPPGPGINPDPAVCRKYGAPSECGFAKAVDGYSVLTCADWGPSLTMPDGEKCDNTMWDDTQCNLGHESPGVGFVCSFGVCTMGCYEDKDCPAAKNCSSGSATIGACN